MRLHLTPAIKMWILTSLAFFYIIIQYHVTNTWPLTTTNKYIGGQYNELDGSISQKLWLEKYIGDHLIAENVQHILGEKVTKELADKISNKLKTCSCTLNENSTDAESVQTPIYIVTPTYRRPEQMAELTRMAQTLMHLPNIYWLLIEDAKVKSEMLEKFLKRTGIRYVHLAALSVPTKFKGNKARGVGCRNRGLKWIRENVNDGVLYFADDDNTYDIELFKEMRDTKKVSMWPVGLVTQTGISTPIVKNGKFHGFYDGWIGGRKFPVDMAGFAVNISFLKQRPKAMMAYKIGYEEDYFLQSLAPFDATEIELKADNCTKVLVWHTQTKKNPPSSNLDKRKYADTNLIALKNLIV